jgi:hypothetical protein
MRRAHGSRGYRQLSSVILVLNYGVLPFVRRIYDVPMSRIGVRGVGITGALPVPERGRGHEMTARVTVCGPAWRA